MSLSKPLLEEPLLEEPNRKRPMALQIGPPLIVVLQLVAHYGCVVAAPVDELINGGTVARGLGRLVTGAVYPGAVAVSAIAAPFAFGAAYATGGKEGVNKLRTSYINGLQNTEDFIFGNMIPGRK